MELSLRKNTKAVYALHCICRNLFNVRNDVNSCVCGYIAVYIGFFRNVVSVDNDDDDDDDDAAASGDDSAAAAAAADVIVEV